jgi:drug/metabolite transporter (DMT)-like permease
VKQSTAVIPVSPNARWLVVAAAVLWSTSGLFAKAPLLNAFPLETRGLVLAFWRTFFAGLFLVPFIRRPQWSWWLVPSTLLFALMNVSYLTAMTRTTAANAIWLQNTAPLWVLLFGVGLFGERAQRADWWMLGAVLLGLGLILVCESRSAWSGLTRLDGVAWAIASGLFYATVILSLRALRRMDAVWLISLNHLVTAVILLPLILHWGQRPTGTQLGWLAAFGILQMGLPYVLFARGVRSVPSHQASFIVLLEPILVPVWVWLAWRHDPSYEPPAWWTLAGGGMILLGLLVRFGRPVRRANALATT